MAAKKKKERNSKKEVKKENKELSLEEISKEEIKKQNKILKNFFILIGVFILIIAILIIGFNSAKNFEYRGLDFSVEKYGDLIFYKILFPLKYKDETTGKIISTDYVMRIRNDPRKLEKEIPFEGEILLLKNMVINQTGSFNCDGDGVIAIANLLRLNAFGIKIIRDENATCDELGRYTFVQIQSGNKSSIEQVGPSCYNLNINNCEILKVTERFMIEYFVEVNKLLKK